MRLSVALAVFAFAACATPEPSPTLSAAVTRAPATATPTLPATHVPVLQVGDWSAGCDGVGPDDCQGVAALFVNNLARSQQSVFEQSGGTLSVEPRPDCPIVPDWADPGFCWQASALVPSGSICMVIARQGPSRPDGFGQVGGDDMAGLAGGPPEGWPRCA
jgi:hypothetical protein